MEEECRQQKSKTNIDGKETTRKRKYIQHGVLTKKRQTHKESWIKEQKKMAVNKGLEYKDDQHKVIVKARKIQKACDASCRYGCGKAVDDSVRQMMFDKFWALKDRCRQWTFLSNLMTINESDTPANDKLAPVDANDKKSNFEEKVTREVSGSYESESIDSDLNSSDSDESDTDETSSGESSSDESSSDESSSDESSSDKSSSDKTSSNETSCDKNDSHESDSCNSDLNDQSDNPNLHNLQDNSKTDLDSRVLLSSVSLDKTEETLKIISEMEGTSSNINKDKSRKSIQYFFKFQDDVLKETEIRVCRTMFLKTFDISQSFIKTICGKKLDLRV